MAEIVWEQLQKKENNSIPEYTKECGVLSTEGVTACR